MNISLSGVVRVKKRKADEGRIEREEERELTYYRDLKEQIRWEIRHFENGNRVRDVDKLDKKW